MGQNNLHVTVVYDKSNGFLSDQIHISRGVRQGCPVSALLFIQCIEILGIKVRQHRSLHGFDLSFPQKW